MFDLKLLKMLKKNLFKYIEIYYNQRRKYSANGWKTPAHCDQVREMMENKDGVY